MILFIITSSHHRNRSDPFFALVQIKSNTTSSLKVNHRYLVPRKKGPGLSGGEKSSVLRCEIRIKALRTAFSQLDGDAVKHLTDSGCTVAPAWLQTLPFHSISNNAARVSFLSFSFEWPQGGQEDKDDRIILAALYKEPVSSPDTVTIKVPGWLLMGITSRTLPLKTTVLRSVFCSYKQIACLGVVLWQLHSLSIRKEQLRVLLYYTETGTFSRVSSHPGHVGFERYAP